MMTDGQIKELRKSLEDQIVFPLDDVYRQVDGTLLVGFLNGYDFHLYVRQGNIELVTYFDHGVRFYDVELGSDDAREFIREGYVIAELSDYEYVKDMIGRGIPLRLMDNDAFNLDKYMEMLTLWSVDTDVYRGFTM